MKLSIKALCLIGVSTAIFASGCNRLNSTTNNINSNNLDKSLFIEVTSSSNVIETGRPVSLNISIHQRVSPDSPYVRLSDTLISSADIIWTASDGGFSQDTGYKTVYTASNTSANVLILVGLRNGSKYAELGVLESPGQLTLSVAQELRPATPTELKAVPSDNMALLTWKPNTEAYLGGYHLYYSTIEGGVENRVTLNASATSYTKTGLMNKRRYYFSISAFSNNTPVRASAISKPAVSIIPDDVTPPSMPTLQTVTQMSAFKKARISWKNPTDSDFSGVRILRRSDSSEPINPSDGVIVYEGPNSEFIDEIGLEFGKEYTYYIYAYDDEINPLYSNPAKDIVVILGQ